MSTKSFITKGYLHLLGSPLVRGEAHEFSSDREIEQQHNNNLLSPGCWQKTVDTVRHFYLLRHLALELKFCQINRECLYNVQANLCTYPTSVPMYIPYKRTHVRMLQAYACTYPTSVRMYIPYLEAYLCTCPTTVLTLHCLISVPIRFF